MIYFFMDNIKKDVITRRNRKKVRVQKKVRIKRKLKNVRNEQMRRQNNNQRKGLIRVMKKENFTPSLESRIRRIGRKVFHKNKISRMISKLAIKQNNLVKQKITA